MPRHRPCPTPVRCLPGCGRNRRPAAGRTRPRPPARRRCPSRSRIAGLHPGTLPAAGSRRRNARPWPIRPSSCGEAAPARPARWWRRSGSRPCRRRSDSRRVRYPPPAPDSFRQGRPWSGRQRTVSCRKAAAARRVSSEPDWLSVRNSARLPTYWNSRGTNKAALGQMLSAGTPAPALRRSVLKSLRKSLLPLGEGGLVPRSAATARVRACGGSGGNHPAEAGTRLVPIMLRLERTGRFDA